MVITQKVDRRPRTARLFALILCLLGVLPIVRAQDAPPATPTPPPVPGAGGEISLTLERFGVGDQARVGDWAGIRIGMLDNSTKPSREVIVRLETRDADGDKPLYQRQFSSNSGTNQPVWLYLRLPFDFGNNSGSRLVVRVYAAEETSGAGEAGAPGFRAGRLLGELPVAPNQGRVLPAQIGLIGVFGKRSLGLEQYARRNGTTDTFHELGTEVIERATDLSPQEMPDRWMGLAPMEAVVWADGDPAKLRGDQSKAVRDWVNRGGHLIIILPNVGQTFTNPTSNELYDIMPAVSVVTREKVNFEPYRPLFSLYENPLFPKTSTIQVLTPRPEAGTAEAIRVLNGPDNDCVVARRLVGAGAVTLVGLDLNQTALAQGSQIQAEVFWHRVLGKRGTLIDPNANSANSQRSPSWIPGQNQAYTVDQDIAAQIAKTGRSAAGVLAGLIVFALYWAIAGPIGFAVLKRRGLSHHSWVFFIASAGVFTALAWGGATALRPKRIEATHFTVLDHVFGQPVQRARMWASVLVPRYGKATIGVGDPKTPVPAKGSLNAISPWDAPDPGAATDFGGFPDAQGYTVDSRYPDQMTVPTRSTVKQVQVDWAGGPPWEMPFPIGEEGKATGGTLVLRGERTPTNGQPLVTGTLQHNLPGTLSDVMIVVVTRQTPLDPVRPAPKNLSLPGPMRCTAYAFPVAGVWPPGQPLYLDNATVVRNETNAMARSSAAAYLEGLIPTAPSQQYVPTGDPIGRPSDRYTALAFLSQLPQPDRTATMRINYIPQRLATHGWDLGVWFTQPCVIIVGQLGASVPAESPVPLTVDGEKAQTLGRTLVRWVYPLPDNPPRFPVSSDAKPDEPANPG
ncbi:MAG: hypothetical protein JSR77_13470 [Planctomycetes bacterium]|nr:hypothetical protein [Planctomycetota bacterium]